MTARTRWDGETAIEAAKVLAAVCPQGETTVAPFTQAVRCLLFDLWNVFPFAHAEIEAALSRTWAGDVLDSMKAHYAACLEVRRARDAFESPEAVQRRREEKKRLKQEQHARRLALKAERDRIWRANNPPNGADHAQP